ncbi:hypothetical protein [Craurococcus roseus]
MFPLLRAALFPLALACAASACGAVVPASGPPTYGDGRGNSSN